MYFIVWSEIVVNVIFLTNLKQILYEKIIIGEENN